MTEKVKGYPWLKLWTDLPTSPKLRKLTDAQKWRYIQLYAIAQRSDAGGLLAVDGEIMNDDAIAYDCRVPLETMQGDIQALLASNLLDRWDGGYNITAYLEEQGTTSAEEKREQWRERQRKHRAKLKTKTQEKELDEDIDQEKEEEIDKTRSHANVTRDNSNVIVSFLSLFNDVEKSILKQFDDELEKDIADHFKQAIEDYGKEKTFQYLRWILEEGDFHTWQFAYNNDKKNDMVKKYQPVQKPQKKEATPPRLPDKMDWEIQYEKILKEGNSTSPWNREFIKIEDPELDAKITADMMGENID